MVAITPFAGFELQEASERTWLAARHAAFGGPGRQTEVMDARVLLDEHERLLAGVQGELDYQINWHSKHAGDVEVQGVAVLSDRELVAGVSQTGFLHSYAKDRQGVLVQWLAALEGIKVQDEIAVDRLTRIRTTLERAIAALEFLTDASQAWSKTYIAEYDRRHPEAQQLPVEPIDLGPTDSAFLPSAF